MVYVIINICICSQHDYHGAQDSIANTSGIIFMIIDGNV